MLPNRIVGRSVVCLTCRPPTVAGLGRRHSTGGDQLPTPSAQKGRPCRELCPASTRTGLLYSHVEPDSTSICSASATPGVRPGLCPSTLERPSRDPPYHRRPRSRPGTGRLRRETSAASASTPCRSDRRGTVDAADDRGSSTAHLSRLRAGNGLPLHRFRQRRRRRISSGTCSARACRRYDSAPGTHGPQPASRRRGQMQAPRAAL